MQQYPKTLLLYTTLFFLVAPKLCMEQNAHAGETESSLQNLPAFEKSISQRRQELLRNMLLTSIYKGKAPAISLNQIPRGKVEAAEKEVRESSEIQVFDLILKDISTLKDLSENDPQFKSLANEILLLSEAAKVEGALLTSKKVIPQLKKEFKTWSVARSNSAQLEAKNLVNPITKRFYTSQELSKLGDASMLNPPDSSSFWKKQNISQIDVTESYLAGKNELYSGLDIFFPKDESFELDYVIFSQSKPKMAVSALDPSGKKFKYKLKVGLETHADPTVSALSTTLGFYNDITKHVTNLKLRLGKTPFSKFKLEFKKYYGRYELEKLLKQSPSGDYVHRDSKGDYIVFLQASLEPKVSGLLRAGPWAWGSNDNPQLREARALLLFNIWIGNNDLKESENNMLLVKPENGKNKIFRIQHDLGASLGGVILESPEQYPLKLIHNENDKAEIRFDFVSLQENSNFKTVTYADMKWMARLIAELQESQIEEAVKLGAWPAEIGQLVFEKLKSRRNQIVRAFDLDQEGYRDLPTNEKLTTPNGIVKNGRLKKDEIEGFPQDFDMGLLEFAAPELKKVGHGLVRLGTSALSNLRRIHMSGLDLDSSLFSSVILSSSRDFAPNPDASSTEDSFIVKDRVEIGFELSPNVYIGVGGRVQWTYTLLYTASSELKAQYAGNTVLNLLLPISSRIGKLPEKYILITENSLAGKGFLRSDLYGSVDPIGMQISESEILLGRTIVSNKDGKTLRLYKDTSLFNELEAKIYAKLLFLRIPLMSSSKSQGNLKRKILEIPLDQLNDSQIQKPLSSALASGNIDGMIKFAKVKNIDSKFEKSLTKYDLKLFGSKNIYSIDQIEEEDLSRKGDSKKQNLLFRMFGKSSREAHWSAVDDGESVDSKVTLTSLPTLSKDEIREPVIHLNFTNVDNNTKSAELSEGYMKFAAMVADDANFMQFTPDSQSTNNVWGKMSFIVNVVYHPEAVRALLQLDTKEFWSQFRADPSLNKDPIAYHRATAFTNRLEAAQKSKTQILQMKELIKALRAATWKRGILDTHLNGRVLGLINRMVTSKTGVSKIYINALGAADGNRENKMPGRLSLYGIKGTSLKRPEALVLMSDGDPVELYQGL